MDLYNVYTQARKSIIQQGESIGVNWDLLTKKDFSNIDRLTALFDSLSSPDLNYPDYYLKPFHAYDEGNLSWQAAIEVEPAALSVHAPIYTPSRDILDVEGDSMLRDMYHSSALTLLRDKTHRPIKHILDVGCSTGLSTLKLHKFFPEASIVGLDLSPYMLSVAQLHLERESLAAQAKISYVHGAAEQTPLPDHSIDLASMSLVAHELPAAAFKAVFQDIYRMLRPGGVVTFMDMDPYSPFFQRFTGNAIAFTAFRATEPWVVEYMEMDVAATLKECGYSDVSFMANSCRRHRTVVAIKK